MGDISIKRTITINGVTYDDMDAIPADVREQYAPLLKMMAADEDVNGIPDIIERHAAKAERGELVTEKLVEMTVDHNGMRSVANPEVFAATTEVTKKRRVEFTNIPQRQSQNNGAVQRRGEGGGKRNVLMVVLLFFLFAFLHLYFKK